MLIMVDLRRRCGHYICGRPME